MSGRSLLWDTTRGSTPLRSTRQFWPLFTLLLPNFPDQRAEIRLSNHASIRATVIFISPSPTLRRCCSNSAQGNMSGSGVGVKWPVSTSFPETRATPSGAHQDEHCHSLWVGWIVFDFLLQSPEQWLIHRMWWLHRWSHKHLRLGQRSVSVLQCVFCGADMHWVSCLPGSGLRGLNYH